MEAANIPGAMAEDDKDIATIIAGLHARLAEHKTTAKRASDHLKKKHNKELSEVDASAYAQGAAVAESRLNAQLEDLSEIIHRDSFSKGWSTRGSASAEEASVQTLDIPPFVMPDYTPPDKPH